MDGQLDGSFWCWTGYLSTDGRAFLMEGGLFLATPDCILLKETTMYMYILAFNGPLFFIMSS